MPAALTQASDRHLSDRSSLSRSSLTLLSSFFSISFGRAVRRTSVSSAARVAMVAVRLAYVEYAANAALCVCSTGSDHRAAAVTKPNDPSTTRDVPERIRVAVELRAAPAATGSRCCEGRATWSPAANTNAGMPTDRSIFIDPVEKIGCGHATARPCPASHCRLSSGSRGSRPARPQPAPRGAVPHACVRAVPVLRSTGTTSSSCTYCTGTTGTGTVSYSSTR